MRTFILLTATLLSATAVLSSHPKGDPVNVEVKCLTYMKPKRAEPGVPTDGADKINAMCADQTGANKNANKGTEADSVRIITEEMKDHNSNCALAMGMAKRGQLDKSGNINVTAAADTLSRTIVANHGPSNLAEQMKLQVPLCVQNTTQEQFPILKYHECLLDACKHALQ
ncbi:uncharacterized protein LOC135210497 [Macrobrachium nipponense]|uniref:uncharacterized protein LOC135210497 n=1 Tax=Macrobrachium nipponense TaxID=159736 RepID=UPI0030C7FD4B